MGLAEDLSKLENQTPHNECATCWALKDASIEDRQAVDHFLEAQQGFARLIKMLKANDYVVSYESLRKHHQNGHKLT